MFILDLPLYADAWYKKGIAFYKSGQSLEAELSCYNRALEIDASHVKSLYAKGWVLYEMGNIKEAEHYCSKAKILAPKAGYIWYEGLTSKTTSED